MRKLAILFTALALAATAQVQNIPNTTFPTTRSLMNANFSWLANNKLTFPVAWGSGTTYNQSDVVTYLGFSYASVGGSNVGNTPSPTSLFWTPLTTGGATWGLIGGTFSDQSDLGTALGGKEPTITGGSTSQYWRGDKTFQTLSTAVVSAMSGLYAGVGSCSSGQYATGTVSAAGPSCAQVQYSQIGGSPSAVIACVGTPGNTTGAYRSQCQTTGGALYACNNASGCTVAADWVSVGSVANPISDEVPSGTINGSNTSFTLSQVPNPSLSLQLYKNGVLQIQGTDYTLSSSTITFTTAPSTSDTLLAFYSAGNAAGVPVQIHSINFTVIKTGPVSLGQFGDLGSCTITGWSLMGDSSGSATIEIDAHANSAPNATPTVPNNTSDKISASAPLSVTSAQSASGGSTEVSTWTRVRSGWDTFGVNVTAFTGFTYLNGVVWCK